MYCPVCFQDTLKVKSSGVIKVEFNGKARDTSLFTYNLIKETPEQRQLKLKQKIDEFFQFYAGFKNKDPIKSFMATSGDFECTNRCKIDFLKTKVNVVGLIFTRKEVLDLLEEAGKKYQIEIKVNFDE